MISHNLHLPSGARALTRLAVSIAMVYSLPVFAEEKAVFDHVHEVAGTTQAIDPKAEEARLHFSPYAERSYPTQVYFGDTHHHSANSADAFMNGDRLSPEQSYRFAKGEEVVSSTGVPMKLSRPMDFLVVSDHAEAMGVMYEIYNDNPKLTVDPTLKRWSKAVRAGGDEAQKTMDEIITAQGSGTLPKMLTNPKVAGPVMKSVWEKYLQTADEFNQPGKFTALIGYEWSSVPGGNNLHRNVIFRDGSDKARQVMPFTSWQSEDPEKLWDWMERYEGKTGGQLLAIPHNANVSNGRMFELIDFTGKPLTKEYAERRARWEVLQEIVQTKGASETHPTLSPNDEFANYGTVGWDNGNLTLDGERETPEMRKTSYLRAGLLRGLELEEKLGSNPFKFGIVGGTDVHNSLSSIEEDNYMGKHVQQEASANRWSQVVKNKLNTKRYTWQYLAAGYAGVWASENTRESLWDAMKRKETYATSGSRMTVRFFGGWDFNAQDANPRALVDAGYSKGVPMGANLPAAKADQTPSFLVSALKDPQFGNIDRIQIVKGWVNDQGVGQEKVYDVVWSDAQKRKPDAKGKLPSVGNTVDVKTATWANSIGAAELSTVWRDPDFNAHQRAFYYARVIEIPTPHWAAYDAVRFGVKMGPEVPMTHQERAWTSPIWYTPEG